MKEITLISAWDVCTKVFGEEWRDWPAYEDQWDAGFGKWVRDHNALYYARPRESFFVSEAVELAHKGGHSTIVLEDMS